MNRTVCASLSLAVCMLGACASNDPGSTLQDDAAAFDASAVDAGAADSAATADATKPDSGAVPRRDGSSAPDAPAPPDVAVQDTAPADVAPEAGPTTLDLHQATIYDNPPNLADWPVTTLITDVWFQYPGWDGIHVEFSKRDGPNSWPDVTPPGWTGPLEYTIGLAEYINGQWYASAAIQVWRGLPAAGGNLGSDINTMGQCTAFGYGSSCQVAKNWYYDGRWGNLAGYQPATNEVIGVFVVAGNVRGVTDGSQSPVQERSNVVLVPMPTIAGANYMF